LHQVQLCFYPTGERVCVHCERARLVAVLVGTGHRCTRPGCPICPEVVGFRNDE
jgi:hypothetical protein